MKKLLSRIIFIILLVCFLKPALALPHQELCDGTKEHPCLVQDTEHNSAEVKHFRDAAALVSATKNLQINSQGLRDLLMSGSAAPSIHGWKTIVTIIKRKNRQVDTIVDVDLRQESHGYLNNNALTLASANDWINLGKTREEVLTNEQIWLNSLAQEKDVYVLKPKQFNHQKFNAGKQVVVKEVADEENVVKSLDFQYLRLTVSDHMMPSDEDVDRFLEFTKSLKPNTWVHFHCRGGDGRTTTFMVMYDMLHNADKATLEDIILRQASVAPFYNILSHTNKNSVVSAAFQKRAQFIKQFYTFALAYRKGYTGKWAEWKKDQSSDSDF